MKTKEKYLTLFLSTLQLSACTFGGGYVIVPLMRRKFEEDLKWISEEEMMDLVAIAQSSPGAIAVNASILIGYRVAGVPGALVTVLGTVLPPLVIISVISLFYQAFRDNQVVSMVMKGMQAGVAAVILSVAWDLGCGALRAGKVPAGLVMAAAFAASFFLDVNVVLIILAAAVLGALGVLLRRRKEGAA